MYLAFYLLPIIFSILLFLLLTNYGASFFSEKSRRLPPSPFKLPLIGNLHNIDSLPHRSLCALSNKYGPLMLLHLGQVPTLVVSSADMAREVLKTQDHIFASRPSLKVPEQLLYGCTDAGFAPYGEYWRNVRKISMVHLLGNKMVQSYQLIKEEEVEFMIGKISELSIGVVNMSEILSSLANDVVSRVASGKWSRGDGRNSRFRKLTQENSELMGAFNVGDYFPAVAWWNKITGFDARVRRTAEKWDELLEEIIEDHTHPSRDRSKNDNFVDILLSLQKDPNMEFSLTRENIKAIIESMFAAGTDTSYIVLEWAMSELIRNSEMMKKLQDEVRGIASGKAMVKEEDLSEMNYLKAVIKETLRLHPPAPLLLPHESMENTQIQGYEIPNKTRVLVNAWAIGRDSKYWEASEEFRPERFLSSPIDFKGHDFQFIPFGAGRRVCPGMQFAASTMELALANLIHQFEWKLPNDMKREDLDMAEAPGLTTRKEKSLHLVATPYSY